MKKIAAMTAIVALVSMPVLAAEQGGFTGPSSTTQVSSTAQAGGFTGPSGAVTTVANAKSLRDDTWVTLRGKITERISDDLYKFQDASGVINVDIDHKRWNGVTVGPQDTVEIQGEVDKDWNSVEIDVKQIRKIAPKVFVR
ncbi:TIGR00156 family protein [Klebsiella variicola]|nr:YgiW/YdeI family stress tolerance OB fold protein [Klebsiella variicola]GKM85086.1 TIGR00156 family protein [Klebsiella variicola]HCI8813365.1 YgiW/YdeI family stress tolerance OB fold protein [Klebsiella variicola]